MDNGDVLKPGEIPRIRPGRIDDPLYCTRAEFAERFEIWPAPDTIGTCIVSPDGTRILQEFIFTDEPYASPAFLSRNALREIAELERLLKL